jgi:gamma-glutamyltranspeptidase
MTRLSFVILLIIGFVLPAHAGEGAVTARHGMVVAQEKHAAKVGAAVLERGGNAVDAAVTTGFALAVTYPRAGNIGGGGFMVIRTRASRAILHSRSACLARSRGLRSRTSASALACSRSPS